MSNPTASPAAPDCPVPAPPPGEKVYYLAGIHVTHSIAPNVHNLIAQRLSLPWTFHLLDIPTLPALLTHLRSPACAGAVITMPYKQSILPHLDALDPICTTLGSCNNVYRSPSGQLIGSNTDWLGILGCLTAPRPAVHGRPALLIGAGGAARAAVYALHAHLKTPTIYVLNRDASEVAALRADAQRAYGADAPELVHVTALAQAAAIPAETLPYYVVGTVPDFEPVSDEEKAVAALVRWFLDAPAPGGGGVALEMCFNPRKTRFWRALREREAKGWTAVEGIEVVGWQVGRQYELWVGPEAGEKVRGEEMQEEVWRTLREAADANPMIN
ncbi:quinate 5-dehydrogenase, protein [Geopyxis carbonaria]|nr:quinate 5-dehydrogenase, protein [Geopyxis carbonaria]